MAAKTKTRLVCRALDFLEAVPEGPPPVDVTEAFREAKKSPAPIRTAVEARSDYEFVEQIRMTLRREGLADSTARFATHALLTYPTIAVTRPHGTGGSQVVQAVLLETTDPQQPHFQLVAHADIRTGKPPQVTMREVTALPVDLDDESDALSMVQAVETWHAEHALSLRTPTTAAAHLPGWAWLGDPGHCGILGVPPDWLQRVRTAGLVYDSPPLVMTTEGQRHAQHIEQRINFAVAVRGARWAEGLIHADGTPVDVVRVGQSGAHFETILAEARVQLLTRATTPPTDPHEARELTPGEVVYHRKVGNSRKFDSFDAGSSSPCGHGAHSFRPWGGDKAVKGMRRRYTNFTDAMLIHCDKFPACGMYGLDASRGGLRPPT